MQGFDFTDMTWERIPVNFKEFRIDQRWQLMGKDGNAYGALRIVSHPDLKPGHLKAFFNYISSIREKNSNEILKTIEDYQVEPIELEVYSIKDEVKMEQTEYTLPLHEIQEIFGVKII